MTSATRDQRGSITPLIIGLAVIVAMLVVVVVDASAGFLRRESLNSVADAAALAATDGIQGESAYTIGLGEHVAVDQVAARRFVTEYLTRSGAIRKYPDLTWAVSVRGQRVAVRLSAPLDLPLPLPGMDPRASIVAMSSAVVTVGE